MKLLLDTHLLLWAAGEPGRLPADAAAWIDDPSNDVAFSAASIWEVTIKRQLRRGDFRIDPKALRRGLLDNGYLELSITGAHALAVEGLPNIHADPFDRILIAQAIVEGLTLLTSDALLARYPGPVRVV